MSGFDHDMPPLDPEIERSGDQAFQDPNRGHGVPEPAARPRGDAVSVLLTAEDIHCICHALGTASREGQINAAAAADVLQKFKEAGVNSEEYRLACLEVFGSSD